MKAAYPTGRKDRSRKMKLIVFNGAFKQKHKDMITETAQKVNADVCFVDSDDDIPEEYRDAEVVYGFGMSVSSIVKQNVHLKWLCVTSAGVEHLFRPGVFANEDCIITNSAGAYGVSIAEHIIAVSLMMMRKLTYHYGESVKGSWGTPVLQRSLKDSRITVLGTGDIGCTFARRARAFEPAELSGICRSGKCSETAFDKVVSTDRLDEILPETDLLVMCLPGTPETEGILSRERIAMLPEGAYIVNVGRGSAIDEDALADSLDSGRLGGAALDVFVTEPLPKDSRLWHTGNVLITPHIAGNMTLDYTVDRNVEMFCEDLMNYAAGKPLKHIVDRKKGY